MASSAGDSAGDAAPVPRYPSWVLLEKKGYDDDHQRRVQDDRRPRRQGDRLVYLLSEVKMDDHNTWIVGVDLAKKMVKPIQPCEDLEYHCIRPAFVPSTFSYYLNTTPGDFSPTLINHSEKTANNAKVSDLLSSSF
uniref:DUF1618 domain-containing protein n=1 Tax=Aegilops tauschii subsp. strangulata TaxID=200361 RepID=A0A453GHZ9_AEGTS